MQADVSSRATARSARRLQRRHATTALLCFAKPHAASIAWLPSGPARSYSSDSLSSASSEASFTPFKPSAPGFRVLRVTGDGSCMFRAIVQGMQMHITGRPMPEVSESTAALNLRIAVVQELRKNKETMEPFIAGITDNWEDYLARMSLPAAWGGEPEMFMAVNVIRRPITVYHNTPNGVEPIVTYGEDLHKAGIEPVHLLWSGMHYDLLVPAHLPPEQPPPAA